MDCEQRVINGPELVASDDQDLAAEAGNQVAHGVSFPQWDQQAAGALEEKIILSF